MAKKGNKTLFYTEDLVLFVNSLGEYKGPYSVTKGFNVFSAIKRFIGKEVLRMQPEMLIPFVSWMDAGGFIGSPKFRYQSSIAICEV